MNSSCCCCGFTEALLDALSSSLHGCGAAPLRDRGEDAGALRRDLGGLVESSYSSANEKRSLNLTDKISSTWLVSQKIHLKNEWNLK